MNPIKNWLKSLSVTTFNVVVALVFFIITAKITDPQFFGRVAIIQLLEVIVATIFFFLPSAIVTREISYFYAKGEHKPYVRKFLAIPFVALPFLLVLFAFPLYVWLTIPYLFLYLFTAVENAEMIGMDMFTESAVTGITFLVIRWGISIIAVLLHNLYLFIGIWTLGGVIATSLNYFFISRKVGFVFPDFDVKFLIKSFRESLPLFLSNVTGFLSSQGDRVITSYLLGSYYLGIYQFSALVASVPSMLLGSLSNVILPTASFYKVLGKDEGRMSSISFRVTALLTLVAIFFLPVGEMVISHFFPDYSPGIPAFVLLLIASSLPFPISVLSTFIVAFKRDLRPFLVLTVLNALTVLTTSFLLIPRIGIMGGALSQIIVSAASATFTLFYALKTKVFFPTTKEYAILSILPLVGIYEVFVDPPFLDVLLLIAVLLAFKFLGIIERDDVELIRTFLPRRLNFVYHVLRILSK
ncbi:MAG: oligosaccharide flippase family protein [Candidatus Aramenus sp.]|jgi:O-antigen/teichoic acid export membrane protein|nr:oligosaccharide flippase family protein [Candidatus Aramenus sp.]